MAVNLFNANFYRAANPDLASFNDAKALSHFQNYGLKEGRAFSPFVNLNFYRASNPDLASFSNQQAFNHLQNNGVAEGRRFSPFADLNFYRASNSDLAGLNNEQLFGHLQSSGVAEGRRFSQFFDVNYYKANNPDLVSAGLNPSQLLEHFERYGLGEGRKFSVSFNVNYYRNVNSDLASAGLNNQQLYEHFQLNGLGEGRASSQQFNITYYRAHNSDLVAAGLNNWQAYQHFVIYGQREGRVGNDLSLPVTPHSLGSFNIQFDYRFDTNGFFNDPNRRATLEAAATIWESVIKDEFADVPVGTATPYLINPQTGGYVGNNNIFTTDIPIDDLVVFVGARPLGSGGLGEGGPSGSYNDQTRYTGSKFKPWAGAIAFDNSAPWFFDATPSTSEIIPAGKFDFLSTAVHELGHVLGIGASNAFKSFVSGNSFNGARAEALNKGNPIPLDNDLKHVKKGFLINGVGSEAALDTSLAPGVRKLPTPLDLALLVDIGYQI